MIIYTAKHYAIWFGDMDFKYEKKVEIQVSLWSVGEGGEFNELYLLKMKVKFYKNREH